MIESYQRTHFEGLKFSNTRSAQKYEPHCPKTLMTTISLIQVDKTVTILTCELVVSVSTLATRIVFPVNWKPMPRLLQLHSSNHNRVARPDMSVFPEDIVSMCFDGQSDH